MEKQNNFRLSKTKNNLLYILSGATLALFAGLTLFPTISESTHAEGDEPDEGISIVVSDSISANVTLFDEGDYKIAKDTVTVSSSAPYGYELFLTTDSEAHQSIYLNDDPTSESRIAPVSGTIAEPATLTDNTWGFAIAGQGNFDDNYDPANPDPASKFAIIPTADDQQAVFENTAATAEDNVDFYYGVKVEPTLEPGEYKTSIKYTAIVKKLPPTAKAILGRNGNLNFLYDSNTYTVGETYTDNIGETEISAVYDVPVNSSENNKPKWIRQEDRLTSANFDPSFFNFKPTSTAYWFYEDKCLNSITRTANLDTSNVTNMASMFDMAGYRAATWTIDNLNEWNVDNVTDMYSMFKYAGYAATTWTVGDLSDWNTENVTNMASMFYAAGYNASTFRLNLSDWNTSNVAEIDNMFNNTGRKSTSWSIGDLSGWDTGKITDMNFMFYFAGNGASSFSLNLSGWNVSNVTDMRNMFNSAGYSATTWDIGDLSGWKVGNVINMAGMFASAGYSATTWDIGDLSDWNIGSATNLGSLFREAGYSATTWDIGDLSGWKVGNVINMSSMFDRAGYSATTWDIGDLNGWDTRNVTSMTSMFYSAGYSATTWDIGDIHNWNVRKVTTHGMFINNSQANIVDKTKLPWQ